MNRPSIADKPAELAQIARQAARAGANQLMSWRGRFETHLKGPQDYVTDADLASQEAIRNTLLELAPDHQFVGEETPAEDREVDNSRICWVVDPLDGTTNYLHDFPSFAVSVAAVRDGKPLAGVVLDPLRDEEFWAAQGGGAWLGDHSIETSGVEKLADSLLAISLPASVRAESPDLIDFVRIAPRCQAVRRIGSAALNLAYVACGRLDASWAREIHPWDVAAGVLLVTEAGGVATGPTGETLDIWNPACAAASGTRLHAELLNHLSPHA